MKVVDQNRTRYIDDALSFSCYRVRWHCVFFIVCLSCRASRGRWFTPLTCGYLPEESEVETGEPGGLERVHACTERAFALPCQAAGCLIGSLATAFHRGGMGSVTAREGANTGEEAPRPPGAPSSAGGLPRRRGVGKPVAEQSVNEPGRS